MGKRLGALGAVIAVVALAVGIALPLRVQLVTPLRIRPSASPSSPRSRSSLILAARGSPLVTRSCSPKSCCRAQTRLGTMVRCARRCPWRARRRSASLPTRSPAGRSPPGAG